MTVVLKHTKGYKNNPRHNHTHEFVEPLDGPLQCHVNPIILILIVALHNGAVAETSWDQLLAALRARTSHRVVWAHPRRPLFCAQLSGGAQLFDFVKPSSPNLGQRSVV